MIVLAHAVPPRPPLFAIYSLQSGRGPRWRRPSYRPGARRRLSMCGCTGKVLAGGRAGEREDCCATREWTRDSTAGPNAPPSQPLTLPASAAGAPATASRAGTRCTPRESGLVLLPRPPPPLPPLLQTSAGAGPPRPGLEAAVRLAQPAGLRWWGQPALRASRGPGGGLAHMGGGVCVCVGGEGVSAGPRAMEPPHAAHIQRSRRRGGGGCSAAACLPFPSLPCPRLPLPWRFARPPEGS